MNTRRKTRRGRLARLDRFVLDREAALLRREGVVVDLGIGAIPWTTLELADALAEQIEPCPPVVGVDHDPVVIARALEEDRPGVRFVEGGFDLPSAARPALLIRAMNVLRDYPPEAVAPAHRRLGEALVEGGLLVEGTCGSRGDVLCAWLVRKTGGELLREGLLFSTDFSRGFAPYQLRDRLPRDLRGATGPDTDTGRFLAEWTAATGKGTARQRFEEAGARLAEVRDDFELLPDGFLVWRGPRDRTPREVVVADLQIEELSVGTGAIAAAGHKVSVHYTGWLVDGTKFDSSLDRGEPFGFVLGKGQVIQGWDKGVQGMKVGGKRKLTVPAELGYGSRGFPGAIPPNSTLVFEVELLGVG